MFWLVVILAGSSAVAGFALNRWPIVPFAAGAWALQNLGRKAGWWGSGLGDGWPEALIAGMVAAAAGSTAGLAARRRLRTGSRPK